MFSSHFVSISEGRCLQLKNLKKMEVIKDIDVPPTPDSAHDALMQQFLIDGFPLFSEIEPPNVIAYYIYRMEQDGVDISGLDFAEILKFLKSDKLVGCIFAFFKLKHVLQCCATCWTR